MFWRNLSVGRGFAVPGLALWFCVVSVGWGQGADQGALLTLRWYQGQIEVTGITVYEGAAKTKRVFDPGDELLAVYSGDELISSQAITIPNKLYRCEADLVDGTLSGGHEELADVHFSVQIPWSDGPMSLEYGVAKQRVYLDPGLFSGEKMTHPTHKVLDNGPDSQRLVIAVLGDGYQAHEMEKFHNDAAGVMTGFLSETPWADYFSYVNVYLVDVVSNESGADHPALGIYKDTALHASYNGRLLTVHYFSAFQAAASVPTHDLVMVIVNDPEYGGSGGPVAVLSTHSQAIPLAIHEAGHTFAGLADEYSTACGGCPTIPVEPNVTNQTTLGLIPWSLWIAGGTPLPTPDEPAYNSVVGIFEGAKYKTTENYRPKRNCMMKILNAGFCEVCRETHIVKLYGTLGVDPIQGVSPDPLEVVGYFPGETVVFGVIPQFPSFHNLSVAWYVNGVLQPGQTSTSLFLNTTGFGGGQVVSAVVTDPTPMVRNDPSNLLQGSVSWVMEEGAGGGSPGVIEMPNPFKSVYEEGSRVEWRLPDPFSPLQPVQWLRNGAPLVDDGRITGSQSRTLVIYPVAMEDTAIYGVTYDTGAKAAAQISSIPLTVVAVGALPAAGALGLGMLAGVLAGLTVLWMWRRPAGKA